VLERFEIDVVIAGPVIVGATFHDLRHYYGSRLAERGLTARQIADAMGHKRISTTERYINRINAEKADDAVRAAMA